MTNRSACEVMIVGAGPVGLTLANLLGAAGVDVLLVEANATTSDVPKAILIDDESFRTFQAIGLADRIRTAVVFGTGARYYNGKGRLLATVRPMVGPYGFPKRSAFGQPDLERILLDGARRYPSVRIAFSTRLTALATDPGGETATLDDGRTVTVRWVVGCDGGRSSVRGFMNVAMRGESFEESWLILDTANDPDDARYTKFVCDPARPAVSVPAPGGGRRYEFMLLPGEDARAMLEDARIEALMAGHRALPPADIVRKTVYTFHALIAERFRHGRRLIAGDAAHMMPPFAGQGMNTGIRDAHNLAWKLAAVACGVAGPELLDSYDVERRPHVAAMIALSVRLGRVVMPLSPMRAWARDSLFRMLSLVPAAKQWVATMRWKPVPRCTAGAFVDPGHGLVGAMLPQPHVTTGDGTTVLLDMRLGNGFALLSGTPHALADPLWDRLGCARVVVTTDDRNPRDGAVGDTGDALARVFAQHPGQVLLIRPDRYVAGAFAPVDEAAFAARFAVLLGTPAPQHLAQAA